MATTDEPASGFQVKIQEAKGKPRTSITVDILKFRTLVACNKGLDKQCRPRSDCF